MMCSVGDESELQTTKLRFSQFLQDKVWLHPDVKKKSTEVSGKRSLS